MSKDLIIMHYKNSKKIIMLLLVVVTILSFACNKKVKCTTFATEFDRRLAEKHIDINSISDEYENVAYVLYDNLDEYHKNIKSKPGRRAVLYEGAVSYYDYDDNLIKRDDNVSEIIICSDNLNIFSTGIIDNKYLVNPFGMLVLDEGFYNFSGDYYYVNGNTHRVITNKIATLSKVVNKEVAKNQICNIGGDIFLSDADGKVINEEGIHVVSNIVDDVLNIDYENIDGESATNFYKDYYCYVNDNGNVAINTFIEKDGKTYFAKDDGRLARNEYPFKGKYFNDKCELVGNIDDRDKSIKQYYVDMLNRVWKSNNSDHDDYVFKNEKGEKQMSALARTLVSYGKEVYVYDKNDTLIKNKFIDSGWETKNYVNENGIIVANEVIEVDGKKYMFDKNGDLVSNLWLFDRKYFDNERFASKENPYITEYRLDRSVTKDYNGYYIIGSGEIVLDDIFIKTNQHLIKNGTYNGEYDERFLKLNTYNGEALEYNYEEVDEGVFTYVHRYKINKDEDGKERYGTISDNNLDEQLSYRYSISSNKLLKEYAEGEMVYFGRYPRHDEKGEVLEKIPWIIMSKGTNTATLMSYEVIDDIAFDEQGSTRWDTSSIRKWLNEEFISIAFSEEEQKRILTKEIGTEYNDEYIKTKDKVYLIDKNDVENESKGIYYTEATNYAMRYRENNKEVMPGVKNYVKIKRVFRTVDARGKKDKALNENDAIYLNNSASMIHKVKPDEKNGIQIIINVSYEKVD